MRVSSSSVARSIAALTCLTVLSCGFSQTTPVKATSADWKFDGKVAWDSLLKQVAFGPRVPGTEAQIQCRDYLVKELRKGCDDVHTQHLKYHWSVTDKDVDIYNIIGTQNWKDAKVRVVLLAHWDSRPFSDGPNSPDYGKNPLPYRPIPGANDGASGAAVLVALAEAIRDRHPDVGVMYLLDDGEDLGPAIDQMLLGVDYFTKNLPDPKPDYGILLDMIGKTDMVVGEEVESLKYAEKLTRAFYANAKQAGLGKTFPDSIGDDVDDDHWPLNQIGIPTMDLIDFKYDQWHTQEDTPAHCSQKSLEQTGYALESFLLKQPYFKP